MESLLSGLPQILLFGSVLYFYLSLLLIFCLFVWADLEESGYHAMGVFVSYLVVFYVWGAGGFFEIFTWTSVGIYIGIGILYSVIKTWFFGKKELKYNGYTDDPSTDKIKTNIDGQIEERRDDLENNVKRWILLWPISLITTILKDWLKQVWKWSWKNVKVIYEKILNMGLNGAERQTK